MAKEAKDASSATSAGTVQPTDQPPYELSTEKQLTDTVIFLVLLFGIFYFLLIRPQQKRVKEHNTILEAMKKGSRIITAGGVHGMVTKIEGDDIVHVEIAPNVRIRVQKSSIQEVLDDSKAPKDTANDNEVSGIGNRVSRK